ncbi:TPA: hypothetical protein DDW69_01175 [candidate division CPR2 bacterium]|uniref:MgpA protein n=1 Tax=candidate division CPR2 bacterium GW2011_GWC1_41_48 TaxID=1618344 RepID=A0A0G0YJE6_UNCC2|nr:MAG: Phosphoesterase RecJ domain protein [candidate division CPR2 bacterium GW2011_GWC2_39_35]KKR29481.1 MAG: Phosphoesterase RecJ domain protein [candidate division CPR2 bacterium GW2011_GWD2_39_7]KKR29706.1 MAG: Phosphoesterase RecJ domain protein [candidate division CPR2 bacterium GW2011_GWD1_39_7]KKS09636.1 MAG: MgpA protein [candidate division CPR2 bacterium GW2011_GWC1_41_48]OGB59491.1 MAG: hypothetical protein A2Y27_00865 [candidate division CPR2 bacterium GWD1_39_7]OGB71709.1 MAG: h
MKTIDKFVQEVRKSKKIAVISHKKPDGDAASSLIALALILNKMGKQVIAFTKTDIHENFPFLPGLLFTREDLNPEEFDLIILLDYNVLMRGEFDKELLGSKTPFFVIDHHPPHLDSEIESAYIDTTAASTTEVLYDVARMLDIGIDRQIATCLLTGLVTDTNSFQNQNTTTKTLQIASDLLNFGGNLQKIVRSTYKVKPVKNWQVLGRALTGLRSIPKYGLAYTVLTNDDLKKYEASKSETEEISNFLILTLKDAKIIMVLIEEEPGFIKVSMRTRDPKINLTEIAKVFGGGGHRGASGFSINGSFSRAAESVPDIINS